MLGLSVKTLRKRCVAGSMAGAKKQNYIKGDRWVIPVATVESTLRQATQKAASVGTVNPPAVEIEALKIENEKLKQALEIQTLRADSHEQLAIERLGRISDLQGAANALSSALAQLQQLTSGTENKKQKWWKRRGE
ncbi:MAG: hypothetical protein EBT09_03780 [Actinobacteria bacterium]|jgi:pimeloyl-CoA synthetase|nr:hypothetical protein [Actinomycetota bacterium]